MGGRQGLGLEVEASHALQQGRQEGWGVAGRDGGSGQEACRVGGGGTAGVSYGCFGAACGVRCVCMCVFVKKKKKKKLSQRGPHLAHLFTTQVQVQPLVAPPPHTPLTRVQMLHHVPHPPTRMPQLHHAPPPPSPVCQSCITCPLPLTHMPKLHHVPPPPALTRMPKLHV